MRLIHIGLGVLIRSQSRANQTVRRSNIDNLVLVEDKEAEQAEGDIVATVLATKQSWNCDARDFGVSCCFGAPYFVLVKSCRSAPWGDWGRTPGFSWATLARSGAALWERRYAYFR